MKMGILMILGVSMTFSTANVLAGKPSQKTLDRGKYLVQVGGCNDCHTDGFAQTGGKVPVEKWLQGSAVGFAGPWGVTYPRNLRNMMASLSEDEWVKKAKTFEARPPMPWFNVRAMSDKDLRAMYQFVHALGARGEEAPDFVPPGVAVKTPYIEFFPKNLPDMASNH